MSTFERIVREVVQGSRALAIRDHARIDHLDCIVVVGASGTGKSTLVDAVRASEAAAPAGLVDVPHRFVTRPRRDGDSDVENTFLSREEFDRKTAGGVIGLEWVRLMDAGREERYGFSSVAPGKMPLYSGNNALLTHAGSVRPASALANALFIGAYAPEEVREARLWRRSPELWRRSPMELTYRMADRAEAVLSRVHVVVENHGEREQFAREEVVRLVTRVAAATMG